MSEFAWWALFAILVLLLAAFTIQLSYRIIIDCCCAKLLMMESEEDEEDFADELRRYTTDFATVVPVDVETKEAVVQSALEELAPAEAALCEKIDGIVGEARIYAQQIPYFLGGNKHLQYFEMNEKFIRCMIGLSGIECGDSPEMKKRKLAALEYVQQCQEALKKQAERYEY